jgi:thiol-disulfide isomerase/thioredoxin
VHFSFHVLQRRQWLPLVTAGQPLLAFLSTNFFIPKLCFMKYIIGLVAMLLPILSGAQSPPAKALSIGDTVPDITLNNIINYKSTSFKTKDIKKPLLLDFFATYCSGCIAALPYFNSLQQEFEDSFHILVVCSEPGSKIKRLLQTNPLLKNIRLPFITSDTILYNLFPHHAIPHEVWISREGVVKAITIADYVNKENLQKLFAGRPLHLPVKTDEQRYDPSLSLADNALAMQTSILFRSTVTGYMNNAALNISGTSLADDSSYKRYYFINIGLLNLCRASLGYRFPLNRFILDIRDSSKLVNVDKRHDWFLTHVLSYELTVPVQAALNDVEQHILNDIAQATGTQIRIEKRQMPCYVLLRDARHQVKDPQSRGGKPEAAFTAENSRPVYVHNGPVSGFIKAMNAGTFDQPQPIVIDESGYSLPVDIDLGAINIKDIAAVQKSLAPYGFDLIKVSRLLPMVVITDIHHQNK